MDTDQRNEVVYYVQDVLMPTITEGLTEMFKINPNDPIRWFGNWLLIKNVQT